jgi:Zn-dependent protease with chaperone function
MLCCLFNTINGILSLLGFVGFSVGSKSLYGLYILVGLLILNIGIISYFIYKAIKDSYKRQIVGWMFVGFSLVNINYLYKIVEHNKIKKNFCKRCINRSQECCHLDCGHKKVNRCYHTQGFQEKPINKTNLLLNILNFLGLIINIISFIIYYRRFRHKCEEDCNIHQSNCK